MFRLPIDLTDILQLADWLELYAILAPDGNSSSGDLWGELSRAALYELDTDESKERKIIDVFYELEQRNRAAGAGYPFEVDNGVLRINPQGWRDSAAYVFCLTLSYFGTTESKPRKLFEQISCAALKRYVDGDALVFGSPRTDMPSNFTEAVTELCSRLGEGWQFQSGRDSRARKDANLDLVAWKQFPDRYPSKLIIFGQCASGQDWRKKLGELQPREFWSLWVQSPLVSPVPMKSFFVPHRIDQKDWDVVATQAGILFDRCRIARYATGDGETYRDHANWIEAVLGSALL